jgi:hypothetical protein
MNKINQIIVLINTANNSFLSSWSASVYKEEPDGLKFDFTIDVEKAVHIQQQGKDDLITLLKEAAAKQGITLVKAYYTTSTVTTFTRMFPI